MIGQYTVVEDEHLECVIKEVNELIAVGWQPFGGFVCTLAAVDGTIIGHYGQAMVKFENED